MKAVDLIVSKIPPKGGASSGEADDYDEESGAGEQAALDDFNAAGKKGDTAAQAKALRDFIEMCYPSLAKG